MKKRLITMLLLICIITSFATFAKPVCATENTMSTSVLSAEEDFLRLTILSASGVEITPTESYYLQDTSGNETIVCVEFTHNDGVSGFGLIDLVDYAVTMYALDADVPFDENDTVIYGGVLDFAILNDDGNTATVFGSDAIVPASTLYDSERDGAVVTPQSERAEIIESMEAALVDDKQMRATEPTEILIKGGDDELLVYNAGSNSGTWDTDCGINAVAMYLRHMDNYFNSTYVHANHSTETLLKGTLAIISDEMWGITNSISMDRLATLTNEYMERYSGSGAVNVSHVDYSWSSYKSLINGGSGKPCILYIGGGKTSYWTSAHAVLGVGYTSGATATTGFIIANSGWSSLKYVQIATSAPGSFIK